MIRTKIDAEDYHCVSPLVLQRVLTNRSLPLRDLYWRYELGRETEMSEGPELDHSGAITLRCGATLRFDTYFGAFFETPWRLHTRLGRLGLHLRLSGCFEVRVLRQAQGCMTLLHEQVSAGPELMIAVPAAGNHFRQHGKVHFELTALDERAAFVEACWVALDEPIAPVGLAAILCTFNRQAEIAGVLGELAGDPTALGRLRRIIVVSQGEPGLAQQPSLAPVVAHLGERLTVIEQPNFGGAGGFGRGLLVALDDPAVDHAVFLDDDIVLEPDALLRMSSFLSLAHEPIGVGGHMLDAVQPTRLYEAGARIAERNWSFEPEHHGLDVSVAGHLDRLGEPRPVHYSGWWCFGFPLSLVERVGMPLPCFIRGDDTEFGLRLHEAGIPTVPVPGLAVWHEPFYVKLGSWQLYYETRNMLVAIALHRPGERHANTRRMARQLLIHLMTYRYYSTALVLRGIEDFLAGPDVFRGSPVARHAALGELRQQHPVRSLSRSRVLQKLPVPRLPRGRPGYAWALVRALMRNAVARTRAPSPASVNVEDFAWVTLLGTDSVALETWWDAELPELRRSREEFRILARRTVRLLIALHRHGPAAEQCWCAAAPEFRSQAFWRTMLGAELPKPAVSTLRAAE